MFRVNKINYKNPFIDIKPKFATYPEAASNNDNASSEGLENLKNWIDEKNKEFKQSAKWEKSRIPLNYFINTKLSQKVHLDCDNMILESFNEWSSASSGILRFFRVYNMQNADILINCIDSPINGRAFEVGHNDLKLKGKHIDKAEITIIANPLIEKYIYSLDKKERIRRTILHEIGHAVGLNHSNNPKDLMFHRGIKNKYLSSNDIKRINELYNTEKSDFII